MIRIAICDDEIEIINQLNDIISRYSPENNMFDVNSFSNGMELIKNYHNYDIIFLDIDMPEMNGIQVAEKIRENDVNIKIIYITNYKNHWRQAFSVRSFGYIVKPFSFQDISQELDEIIRVFKNRKDINICNFSHNKTVLRLNSDEIYYLEYSKKNDIKIVAKTEIFHIHTTLQDAFHKIHNFGFDYPHKSFIVNLLYVKSIKGFNILMVNGDTLPIAQKRTIAFREAHNDFLQRVIK